MATDANTPRPEGSRKLRCQRCGETFYTASEAHKVNCDHCGTSVEQWRGRVLATADNQIIQRLADGPATGIELKQWSGETRHLIERLISPKRANGRDAPESGGGNTVYYLPGDERRAVSLFIAENTEYVRSCFGESNEFARLWDDHLFELLVQQWHFQGYADDGGEADE